MFDPTTAALLATVVAFVVFIAFEAVLLDRIDKMDSDNRALGCGAFLLGGPVMCPSTTACRG